MKLLAILNREIALGASINALAHMTLGLGHRLEGRPGIKILFGRANQVRETRSVFSKLSSIQQGRAIFSDFPHFMAGGDTDKQLQVGSDTSENELIYYGACLLGENEENNISTLKFCSQLRNYTIFESDGKAQLLPRQKKLENNIISGKKICMLINGKLPITHVLNAVALASLSVGQKAKFSDLRLLDVRDKDGNTHANISYHPFVILKPENVSKHNMMANNAALETSLVSETVRDSQGQPLSTVVFGNRDEVDKVITRKLTRLYSAEISEDDFLENSILAQETAPTATL